MTRPPVKHKREPKPTRFAVVPVVPTRVFRDRFGYVYDVIWNGHKGDPSLLADPYPPTKPNPQLARLVFMG